MTNTQSPAPGVAAETTIEQLMALVDEHGQHRWDTAWNERADHSKDAERNDKQAVAARAKIESALRTALQASAAAVEPVAWMLEHDGFTHYSGGRVPSQRTLIFKKPSPEQERYYEGCKTLKFTPLYTAPPLPAQVQEAELSDRDIEEMWNLHMTSKGQARGYADTVRDAFTRGRASRTPAPGMAGGVVSDETQALKRIISECLDALGNGAGSDPTNASVQYLRHAPAEIRAHIAKLKAAAPHPSPAPQAAGAGLSGEAWSAVTGRCFDTGGMHTCAEVSASRCTVCPNRAKAAITASGRDAS